MGSNLTDPPERLRCTARANRTGQRCRRAAISGANVCPTHGGRAPAVKRRAAERVALARARELLGVEAESDPRTVLLSAVKCTSALLEGARGALEAEDADPLADLARLTSAAIVAARVSKLALDARAEERLTAQQTRAGEMLGGMIVRVVEGLNLDTETKARAFALVRTEVEFGHLDLGELQEEISRVADQLREHTLRDAEAGFPERLARAVSAGFAVVDLPEHERERVAAAVEHFLALERQEQADHDALVSREQAGSQAWWVNSPRYAADRGNGGRR